MTGLDSESLDRFITGNYGEDQIRSPECECGNPLETEEELSRGVCNDCK